MPEIILTKTVEGKLAKLLQDSFSSGVIEIEEVDGNLPV